MRVEPSVVVVDLCVVSERGGDADWCDNMQQYSWRLWRLWRAPMLTFKCYLTREMASIEAQPLRAHLVF
jgi:hypothetical protein